MLPNTESTKARLGEKLEGTYMGFGLATVVNLLMTLENVSLAK